MSTKLDARQSVLRPALPMVGSAVNTQLDSIFSLIDPEIAKLFEDRNILLVSDGTVTFPLAGTSVTFSSNIRLHINSQVAGGTPTVIDLGSTTRTLSASGRMVYAVINRTAGTAVVTADSTTLPAQVFANQEVVLIAKRVDATDGTKRVYFRNGFSLSEGQTARFDGPNTLYSSVVTDSATTGANATLAAFTAGLIRLTNASLTSISGIPANASGQFLILENKTGATVIINNNDTGASSSDRILTGSGNVTMTNDSTFMFTYDFTNSKWMLAGGSGSGSGSSGINFVGLSTAWALTSSTDRDAEASVGNWAAYADAAATIPVDMTGGSPNTTITRNTTAGQILDGTASFLLTKSSGASRQGEGVSVVFNVPVAYQGKNATISIPFKVISGSVVENDFNVFVYDVTNGMLITPFNNKMNGSQGTLTATFPVPSSAVTPANLQMRVGIHVASTTNSSVTIAFDDVSVGPNQVALGMAATDWIPYTPTGSQVTNTTYTGFYRRVGDSLDLMVNLAFSGTTNNTNATINLPSGLVIDTSKIPGAATFQAPKLGIGAILNSTVDTFTISVAYHDTTSVALLYDSVASSETTKVNLAQSNPLAVSSGDNLTISCYGIPIVNWSSNVTMGDSSTLKISSFLANGTRVTGTAPTLLGQYRSYLRNAGANTYTETNGAPSVAPSSSNGFLVSTSATYAAADANGAPSKYEIFVGKNKNVTFSFFQSTGKTGTPINYDPVEVTGFDVGVVTYYDPVTGIASLWGFSNGTQTGLRLALDSSTSGYTDLYGEITVSENVLAVGIEAVRSEVLLEGAATPGQGSTNTQIRRYLTTIRNIGSAITYADSATLGASFTINEDGVYSISITDGHSIALSATLGISINSNQLTTSCSSITAANRLISGPNTVSNASEGKCLSRFVPLKAGDIVRPHSGCNSTDSVASVSFSIVKVSN